MRLALVLGMSGMQHVSADCSTPEVCAGEINRLLDRNGDVDAFLRDDGGNQYMVTFRTNWGKLEEAHKAALKTFMKVDAQWMTENTMGELFKRVYQHTFGSDGSPVENGECDLIQKLVDGFWGNIERVCSAETLDGKRCTSELHKVADSYYLAVGSKTSQADIVSMMQVGTRFPDPNAEHWADFGGKGSTVCARMHMLNEFLADSKQVKLMKNIHDDPVSWKVMEDVQIAVAHALSREQKVEIMKFIENHPEHVLEQIRRDHQEWLSRIYWNDEIRSAILETPKFKKIAAMVRILDELPAGSLLVMFRSEWAREDLKILMSHESECFQMQAVVRMYSVIPSGDILGDTRIQTLAKKPLDCYTEETFLEDHAHEFATARMDEMWSSCENSIEECAYLKRIIQSSYVFRNAFDAPDKRGEISMKLFGLVEAAPCSVHAAQSHGSLSDHDGADQLPDEDMARLRAQLAPPTGADEDTVGRGLLREHSLDKGSDSVGLAMAIEDRPVRHGKVARAPVEKQEKPEKTKIGRLNKYTQDELYHVLDGMASVPDSAVYLLARKPLIKWIAENADLENIIDKHGTESNGADWTVLNGNMLKVRQFVRNPVNAMYLDQMARSITPSKFKGTRPANSEFLSRSKNLPHLLRKFREIEGRNAVRAAEEEASDVVVDQSVDEGTWITVAGRKKKTPPPAAIEAERNSPGVASPLSIEPDSVHIEPERTIANPAESARKDHIEPTSKNKKKKPAGGAPSYKDLISRLSQDELYRAIDKIRQVHADAVPEESKLNTKDQVVQWFVDHEDISKEAADDASKGRGGLNPKLRAAEGKWIVMNPNLWSIKGRIRSANDHTLRQIQQDVRTSSLKKDLTNKILALSETDAIRSALMKSSVIEALSLLKNYKGMSH